MQLYVYSDICHRMKTLLVLVLGINTAAIFCPMAFHLDKKLRFCTEELKVDVDDDEDGDNLNPEQDIDNLDYFTDCDD